MSEQIPLFQDEYVLLNDAVGALVAIDLDHAITAFQSYRDLYRSNGELEGMMTIAALLRQGLSACPETGPDRPRRLFAFWRSFENSPEARKSECADIIFRIRVSFFHLLVQAVEAAFLPDSSYLSSRIPIGYAHLQTGQYDRAIRSLQTCLITTPDSAAVYGYLGDAYFLRGDKDVARQIYLEACLVDPETIDWSHLQDDALRELHLELHEEEGYEETLSRQWLPSHAYVRGVFAPKKMRLKEEFKVFVDDYLDLKKSRLHDPSPVLSARLFLKGIVLCDNEPFLRLMKGIDFADVRREMKAANAPLFAAYLRRIERRTHLPD